MEKRCFARRYGAGERGCRASLSSRLDRTVIGNLHQGSGSRSGFGSRLRVHVQAGALSLVSTVSLGVAAKSRSAGASFSPFSRLDRTVIGLASLGDSLGFEVHAVRVVG